MGNRGAVSHGLHAADWPAEYAHLRAEVDAYLRQAIADDGGESAIGARRRSLLEYRARLHRRIVQLDAAIELRGLFDRRGKLRVAWLQQLAGLITTARSLDTLLGTARREKRVPTLAELLSPPDIVSTPTTAPTFTDTDSPETDR